MILCLSNVSIKLSVLVFESDKSDLDSFDGVTQSGNVTDNFRDTLERQSIKRLKGAPQRIIYTKKSENK